MEKGRIVRPFMLANKKQQSVEIFSLTRGELKWTMSKLLIQCLLFVVWIVHLDGQDYQDRPKITTQNGDLILESAYDKKIYLRARGPKSGIYAQDINLLHLSITDKGSQESAAGSDNFEQYLAGPNGILTRLDRLEAQKAGSPADFNFNISVLTRRVNRLAARVISLQTQLNMKTKDECRSNPCENGGTCLNLANGYHCLCPTNWEGMNCQIDVNECRNFAGTDLGCQNEATCINRPGTYECLCKSGWFGLHCTKRAKDCSSGNYEMCGHGTCIPVKSGDGIQCICEQGWETNGTSVACLTDVNECDASRGLRCSANPKVECINLPGSFRCGPCPTGYEGDGFICRDIDECLTIPNGGCSPLVTCHNTIGSRICGPCPPGYQGDGITCTWQGSCNINRGGCHPSAQCVENMAMVQCICPYGMEGDGVGLQGCYVPTSGNSSQHCDNNVCGTHGQCHHLSKGYTCLCYSGYTGAHCDIPVDYCSINPCQNGGSCRPEGNSAGFRCECTAQYSGRLCQIKSKSCSGVLDAEEGSIVYPLNNSSFEHNSKCVWVIHTTPDKVINVTFSRFNLEPEAECMYDFLQIHDGRSSSSQLIGRFCGNKLPKGGNIISSHNNLYLWFRSDRNIASEGFALHWTSVNPFCGGEVDATIHGHINSPGSPGPYPANRDCYWHLTTTLGKRITLHFFELDIENHANCSYDYLAIYDGEHTTDPLINKYCNSTQPPPIQSSSSEVLLHFHSDAYGSGKGFQITYAPMEGLPGCGGYFTLNKGEIVSPSYNGAYLNDLLCEYKIQTGPDTKIRIDFKSFKLERSIRCKYDYLKIYDGPSRDSKLVGKFCGSTHPDYYVSSSNSLFFIFKTDQSSNSDGFKITYESMCQKQIFGDSGVIKSPGYPFNYPGNKVCEFIIGTVPGKAIQLAFQDFDIEDSSHYDCQYDYVEVRDGPDKNSSLLGKFCGQRIPPVQTSTHNFIYIEFNSDMSLSGSGFYANYTTIDTECGGIHRETTGLINHPGDNTNYRNDQKCTWVLIAPEGKHIKLSWHRFDIENSASCNSDYLELVEIDSSNRNESMGKFCGPSVPPSITTTTNRLMLNFKSDTSIRSSGFSLSYTFLDQKTHCGAVYIKSHGFIYSPGWPKRYEPNRDCTWTITVPVGQQIMLNISQFDLERPIRDKCDLGDYLEIRNGASANSPLIGKYCGSFSYKRIVSMANSLYLRFHSDFYMTGNGFKIEWDGTITGCGGTLTSSTGSISSPNYPQSYNENAECFYRIVTSQGSRIRISFTDLDLERTTNCRDDYVEIFDGRDENALSLGKHCYMKPNLNNIETTSNIAFIKFRTDFYIVSKGFLLNYDTICQNNITGRYGVIESPDYPNNYRFNLNCLWTINVPKGNKINITFTNFDIFESYSIYRSHRTSRPYSWGYSARSGVRRLTCDSDYLQWKESNENIFSRKYCGTLPPQIKTSKSNSLQIKLETGSFISRTGFRLEWISYGCGGRLQRRFGSIPFDKSALSEGEMECEWIIESPLGTSITISFTNVYLTDTPNCTIDAIEIYNGQSINSPLITKFCHKSTTIVQSSINYMLIRFVKKSNLKDMSFTTTFHSYKTGCGGGIMALSGKIHSPNYPKNYDNNIDCLWTIVVPKNHRIELNFEDLDLDSDYSNYEDDSCGDSIKIYENGRIADMNYTQIICPRSRVSQVISKSNTLALQFTTNSAGVAKGFQANFTVTCGAVIVASRDGVISNDKFFSHSNRSCIWTITAPNTNQKITLTLTHLNLPVNYDIVSNKGCSSSFLKIRDGSDESSPIIGEYCGHKVPPTIVSRGYALTIELGSYNNKVEGEFSAHYSSLNTACGGTLSSEEGAISSPNYPQPYPVNTDCEWTLATSPGNKVYITFEAFNLEYSEGCNQDYLEIRENNGAGKLLRVYCGNEIPTNTTKAAKLYIKFHSDNKDSNQGFLLHYGFLHGNDITGLNHGEIASPLYPHLFTGSGLYSWRIIVPSGTIAISLTQLEIHTQGQVCSNNLALYDGYDEDASLLEILCGKLDDSEKSIKTSSSAVYIKLTTDETNTGSSFYLRWRKADDSDIDSSLDEGINCGSNITEVISTGSSKTFSSPNYPQNYNNNLNCEWIFSTSPGRHLILSFQSFRLEEVFGCFADYVSIYSSDDSLFNWQPIKEKVCLSEDVLLTKFNATTYIKINFRTDTSFTASGFEAQVSSACGGILSGLSGLVKPIWSDWRNSATSVIECNWNVKVRAGRLIKLRFTRFNITNNDDCDTSVVLRNGESSESPFLSSGKYCGFSHEERSDIITSSNSLFIKYKTTKKSSIFKSFEIWYEEQNVECGGTAVLSSEHSWDEISSPNYPSIPTPYSECKWVFTAPPGEILRIDFDKVDLDDDNNDECPSEYIEVRDGSTELSPLKGRLCGKDKPGTIKTNNNVLFVKYSTQKETPNNGFKANVSIDICGGTIIANSGELNSPGYPHMPVLKSGSVCEWNIIGNPSFTFLIKAQDISLPDSESSCGIKITIEEFSENNTITLLKTYCSDQYSDTTALVETLTNKVTIKLHIGKPSDYTQFSELRGFRFTFNSSMPVCGGTISSPEGYLTTPGYPRDTTLRYCHWQITVPDETRRVTLELLDGDVQRHKISLFNDKFYRSPIQTIPGDDYTPDLRFFESSGNTLALYIWLQPAARSGHRFKARFNSDKEALCGGSISGASGHLTVPTLDRSYYCKWKYNKDVTALNSTQFNTLYLKINLNSSTANSDRCRYSDPKLNIRTISNTVGFRFDKDLCSNTNTETVFRIPSAAVDFTATKGKTGSLNFDIQWKLEPCGGIIPVTEDSVNILDVPNTYNESLNCAWVIAVPVGKRVELKTDGSFQLQCSDEFITISQDARDTSPTIGEYCKDKTQESPLLLAFSNIYIQYHSKAKNFTSLKLYAKVVQNQCGGNYLTYESVFSSPNYPKAYTANQECTWEIKTDLGNRISLLFINRFAVETRPNCTKDAVIIYDWKDNSYIEMARLCGRVLPPRQNSTYNRMKIVLRTDGDINLDGFQARWERFCGGKYVATEKEQYLYSPGYPYGYRPYMTCVYEVTSGGNQNVVMKFLDFELEGPYPDCGNDNLTIQAESSYDYFYDTTYCSNNAPPILSYEKIKLTFKSDMYVNKRGIKLSYILPSCGGEIKEPTVITSNPTAYYDTNLNCTWNIEAPKEKIVTLKFLYFDLEGNSECSTDSVAIFDGRSINEDNRLALMCGHSDNSSLVFKSSNNVMLLHFETDSSVGGKGFQVAVSFTYSEAVGCGGLINLTSTSTYTLRSPIIGAKTVYENYLDCQWTITAPEDKIIKIDFTAFHVAPCQDVNQTALGYKNCYCDVVEIRDGISPYSPIINQYCGHTLPPMMLSSGNGLQVMLHTDGEITSSGFIASLSTQNSVCGQLKYIINHSLTRLKSPGYDKGSVPRGINCVYRFESSVEFTPSIHLRIKTLDIQPKSIDSNQCNRDKLIISSMNTFHNLSLGKDHIANMNTDLFIDNAYLFEQSESLSIPSKLTYCGNQNSIDLYIGSTFSIALITSSEYDSTEHRGFDIEVQIANFCGRNYTEPYGRVKTADDYDRSNKKEDCYRLITAPENYTISAYFLRISPIYWVEGTHLKIYDGDKTTAPRLKKIDIADNDLTAVFSTGRHLLLYNNVFDDGYISYDFVYVITNKGRGCGGILHSEIGKITSPLYPEVFRKKTTCEWELETPPGTRLRLRFSEFDLANICDQIYLNLVNRKGDIIATYCSESPADYTSNDNYVKVVFVTTMNNGGNGWVAEFVGIL